MSSALDFLGSFDIINLLDEIIGDVRSGGHRRFYVSRHAGWSGWDVESLLSTYGVRLWGRAVAGEHISFTVKQRQAAWAEYLMKRAGVPLAGAPVDVRNDAYVQNHAPGSLPPAWKERRQPGPKRDWLDSLLTFFTGK